MDTQQGKQPRRPRHTARLTPLPGLGAGRTFDQEQGGAGRELGSSAQAAPTSGGYGDSSSGGNYGGTTGGSGGYGDDSTDSSGKKQDSTAGKLMEKAGAMFKHDGLAEKGRQKRAEAGATGYDDSTGGSGTTGSGGYGDSSTGGGYGDSSTGGGDSYGGSGGRQDNY